MNCIAEYLNNNHAYSDKITVFFDGLDSLTDKHRSIGFNELTKVSMAQRC